MVKHYFEAHEEENPRDMRFGMRLIRTHRTAFNRQISESVVIQTEKRKHLILNSKSEYNRCALPRLTAKVGEENIKTLEKKKIEEKKAEKELEGKIRNLKMTRNRERRPKPHEQDQPALKKRKTNMNGYKRVIQKPQSEGKRKDSEIEKEKETEQRIKEQLYKDKRPEHPRK